MVPRPRRTWSSSFGHTLLPVQWTSIPGRTWHYLMPVRAMLANAGWRLLTWWCHASLAIARAERTTALRTTRALSLPRLPLCSLRHSSCACWFTYPSFHLKVTLPNAEHTTLLYLQDLRGRGRDHDVPFLPRLIPGFWTTFLCAPVRCLPSCAILLAVTHTYLLLPYTFYMLPTCKHGFVVGGAFAMLPILLYPSIHLYYLLLLFSPFAIYEIYRYTTPMVFSVYSP